MSAGVDEGASLAANETLNSVVVLSLDVADRADDFLMVLRFTAGVVDAEEVDASSSTLRLRMLDGADLFLNMWKYEKGIGN
jgi:hypothetical protein